MSTPFIYIEEEKAEEYIEHMEKAFYHLRKALHCMEEQGLGEEMEKVPKNGPAHGLSRRTGNLQDSNGIQAEQPARKPKPLRGRIRGIPPAKNAEANEPQGKTRTVRPKRLGRR